VPLATDSATAASKAASTVSAVPADWQQARPTAVDVEHQRQPPGKPGQVREGRPADDPAASATAVCMIASGRARVVRRDEFP